MFKNYFKIAFRNLHKHKIYSFINIFGLAIGITSCVLIALYVGNEWSYDTFHKDQDRLYRGWVLEDWGDGDIYFNTTSPIILKPTLEENIPDIEQSTRFASLSNLVKRDDDSEALSQSIQMVDPEFFSMFDFKLLKGKPGQIFTQPNEIVITEEVAQQYFGDEDPYQKSLIIRLRDNFEAFTITGVIERTPSNSSIQYNILVPFAKSRSVFSEGAHTGWFSVAPETYIKLKASSDQAEVEEKMIVMMKQVLGDRYEESKYTIGLQSVSDIHFNTTLPVETVSNNDPTYSYILAAIAAMVLLIACINFMTLSVSQSTIRAKEVGIRKAVGAVRSSLVYQFWGEAILMTALSIGIGLLLADLLLPLFNVLSGTELSLALSGSNVMAIIVLAVFISTIAGMYPAIVLSGFRPMEVLKGRLQMKGDKSLFRQGMVVFQFTVSIFLIVGTLAINNQLNFLRTTDLGFQKDQIIVVQTALSFNPEEGTGTLLQNAEQKKDLLVSELTGYSGVLDVAVSIFTPVQSGWAGVDYEDEANRTRAFNTNFVGANYLETMGIDVVEGRPFSSDVSSDSRMAVVVNQAFVDDYGWDTGLGKKIPGRNFPDHEIIGVVDNFNYQSLYNEVEPLALAMNPSLILDGINNIGIGSSLSPRITLKVAGGQIPQTLQAVEVAWAKVSPGVPFNFNFLDEVVDNQYRQEEQLSQIIMLGSILAIVIACLGLFGLASMMIGRRTKEIGVRKVLGASALKITLLVNREFTRLVIVSFVLAIPLAWYAIQIWIEDFAYKAEMGAGIYILSGIIAMLISWVAVSYQSLKAASINPVNSLRSE